MADTPANNKPEAPQQALDLNSLSGLDFGPNWADANAKPARPKHYGSEATGKRSSGSGPRDRRSGGSRSVGRDSQSERRGHPGGEPSRRDERRGRPAAPAPFVPTVEVDLYPQDEAFEALINRLRSSARTYQLFDIAHLLLEKPDRYIVVVSPKSSKGGEPAQLYYSVPGHLPFETEEEAISYVITNHLDLFFDIEEIEIDPPKGNFQMINRCTITGELLGPPNYHRYQEFIQRHYAARINGMSFERFTSKIEGVKEQEQIDAWLESMKKGARYMVKDRQEGEPESFETLDVARHFLLRHRKEQVVGSSEAVRFAGRDLERLPASNIRKSVEAYVEHQKHFPLDSANNIRGRLRRHKFAVYKKGSKGVSFVCAVKRKFRDASTVFTDSIRNLIDFIEKHPNIPASKLPKEYIGIDTEKQKPEELKMTEAEVQAAAKAKAEAEARDEGDATTDATTSTEAAPAISEDAKASTQATPKAELSAEDEKKLRQLMIDLRWLITEGYVTEYGDGRLFAAPPMPEAKPKALKPKPATNPERELKSKTEAELQEVTAQETSPEIVATEPEAQAEPSPEVPEAPNTPEASDTHETAAGSTAGATIEAVVEETAAPSDATVEGLSPKDPDQALEEK